MIDPRYALVDKRLRAVQRVLAFCSGKGGVGKSVCSSVAGLILARHGYRVGLLDLDFQGSSAHIFLGAELALPEETRGIKPLLLDCGLRLMSFAAFTGERAVPLRGTDVSNAFLELLAITVWDDLEFLVIDMPPGIGDEVLDVMRLIGRSEYVVVSGSSKVSALVVERLILLLREMKTNLAGVVENMIVDPAACHVHDMAARLKVPLLGRIRYHPQLEALIGHPDQLVQSQFAAELSGSLTEMNVRLP